jgi:hypothetical protein
MTTETKTTYSLQGYIEIETFQWRTLARGLVDRAAVEAAAAEYRADERRTWMGIPGKEPAPLRVQEVQSTVLDWGV